MLSVFAAAAHIISKQHQENFSKAGLLVWVKTIPHNNDATCEKHLYVLTRQVSTEN